MNKVLNLVLLITGVAGTIALAIPAVTLFLMLTVIGIPVAIALMAAPTLFLTAALTKFFYQPAKRLPRGVAIAVLLAIGVLAAVPVPFNTALELRARKYVAGDHDELHRPFVSKVVAIRRDGTYRTSDPPCDGFCKRALINGIVDRVLVQTIDPNRPMSDIAASYRLEKRDTCPPVSLPPSDDIAVENDHENTGSINVDEVLQLRIANGECLIRETAPIALADTIITVRNVHRGTDAYGAGLNPAADTIKADRITVEQKNGDNYHETYRRTGVVTYKLWPIFTPTLINGYGFDIRPGIGRGYEFKNIPGRYYEKPDWSGFLTKTLGMDLALRRQGVATLVREKVASILKRPGTVADADQKVIDGYFDGFLRSQTIEYADYNLILDVIDDQRVLLPSTAWAVVRYAKNPPAGYFEHIADGAFKRLRETNLANPREQPEFLGSVINILPNGGLLKHRADFEWLARQDRLRVLANPALVRLADFGADAAPTLLFLIDGANRTSGGTNNDWQHPYLQGMIGLCRLGPQASVMVQPLYDRIDAGKIALWGSYYGLTINTLAAMGAGTEEIWRHVQSQKTNMNNTKDQVRRIVTGRRACYY